MRQKKETLAAVLPGSGHALIDVRSETEFEQSAVPGFISLPLLFQHERHQVGLCYKSEGQAAAIKLGHELVDPHRPLRVKAWIDAIKESHTQQGIIMCWRGGLRSQIATQWIQEAGYEARQLPGGYKQIRQHFLSAFQNPPPLLILAGLTGSGKTELLREFQDSSLDLEAAAQHRGSAFGELPAKQPTQTQFENKLG
ncbi:MAG: rhodanese-like domain-containing protein, partial [Proteobacteria bacterium]|nr:rhodanese-like domain-containing protein [Pseudomonadota bacterium]